MREFLSYEEWQPRGHSHPQLNKLCVSVFLPHNFSALHISGNSGNTHHQSIAVDTLGKATNYDFFL
jgi:hypothetical protein